MICAHASGNIKTYSLFNTHTKANIRQHREYQCSSSLFIQGGAQSVLNDLYCPWPLIERQLKFPSSQSDKYQHIL